MKFMDKLYESVLQDDRIQHFFSGAKLDSVKQSQGKGGDRLLVINQ